MSTDADESGPHLLKPRLCESSLDAYVAPSKRLTFVAVLGAAGVHVGVIASALLMGMTTPPPAPPPPKVTQMVEVTLPPPPKAPEPEPEPERAPEPAKPPPPAAPAPPKAPRVPKAAPPPAAAQAAKVLTAAEEVVDFGDTIVSGKATSYAGGVTASNGTATKAVHDPRASAEGVEGGKGTAIKGDASRPPSLAGGARWGCPFPVEADDAGMDRAVVGLRVEVAADGGVQDVRSTSDPGYGFAREARRCAKSKRWAPGLDRNGSPTRAVALVNVHFER